MSLSQPLTYWIQIAFTKIPRNPLLFVILAHYHQPHCLLFLLPQLYQSCMKLLLMKTNISNCFTMLNSHGLKKSQTEEVTEKINTSVIQVNTDRNHSFKRKKQQPRWGSDDELHPSKPMGVPDIPVLVSFLHHHDNVGPGSTLQLERDFLFWNKL